MKFGSVCSGIEAASVAWHPLGWQAAWLAEIEPFPSAVLAHHYPDVPNIGDMTKLLDLIPSGAVKAPDVFCGGTPCQAFSVAGLRKSLDDARGNLSLTFCEIANAIDTVRTGRGDKPAIIFWENVPGVLSTKDNAFGCFLAGLAGEDDPLEPPGGKWTNAGAVHGPARTVAWRVLDAQYFGVAQRRRRVFVVASARNDFDPAAVLFEFDGVRRDIAPSREAGESAARGIEIGPGGGRFTELNPTLDTRAKDGPIRNQLAGAVLEPIITMAHGQGGAEIGFNRGPTLTCNHEASIAAYVTHSLRGEGFDASEDCTGRGTPLAPVGVTIHGTDGTARIASYDELAQCLRARTPGNIDNSSTTVVQQPVAFDTTQITSATNRSKPKAGDPCHPLAAGAHAPAVAFNWNAQAAQLPSADRDTSINDGLTCSQKGAVAAAMQVRRLTPVECERLQGFPDNYTAIPWRKKPASECPDGPRYKALGNSWAVPNVRWIGQRIQAALMQPANDNGQQSSEAAA